MNSLNSFTNLNEHISDKVEVDALPLPCLNVPLQVAAVLVKVTFVGIFEAEDKAGFLFVAFVKEEVLQVYDIRLPLQSHQSANLAQYMMREPLSEQLIALSSLIALQSLQSDQLPMCHQPMLTFFLSESQARFTTP